MSGRVIAAGRACPAELARCATALPVLPLRGRGHGHPLTGRALIRSASNAATIASPLHSNRPTDSVGYAHRAAELQPHAAAGELHGDVPGVQQRPGQPVQLGDQGSRHRGRLPAPRAGRVGRGWCPSAPWSTSTRSVSTPSTTGRRPGRSAPVRPWTPGRNRSSVPSRRRWCRMRYPERDNGPDGSTGTIAPAPARTCGLACSRSCPAGRSATGQDHNGCPDRYLRHVALQVPRHLPLKVPRLDRLVAENPRRWTRLRDTCASPPRGA